jgi:hypothetical protein
MNDPTPARTERSGFVTAVAWVFIVIAGFATLISVLQNLMINFMFSAEEMKPAFQRAEGDPNLPWFAAAVFQHVRLIFMAFFVVCGATLTAAIGLLRRLNWARKLFIALMVLGIVWNIGSIFFTFVFFSAMPAVTTTAPPEFADQFDTMSKVMIVFNVVLAVLISILLGWIAKRLVSPSIRSEFVPG